MAIKIGRESGIKDSLTQKGTSYASKPGVSFARTLAGRTEALKADALKALLNQVDEQARRVSTSRTIHDVRLYKKYVRAFLQEAVQRGLGTEQFRSWQQGGTRQVLVQTVDKKLIDLTNDLLDKNKDQMELLDRLDEIRGMLINLYI